MQKNTKILLAILLLPSLIAELLSGSTPLSEFINPLSMLFWVSLYGCGALLIREARVRWNMQWSIIFLVIAYGITEEGLTTKAIFNINWLDAEIYSGYGTTFGVMLPWTVLLLTFHATLSTMIPILITDLTWPKYKDTPLLKKQGLILTSSCFILAVLTGFRFMGTMADGRMIPYHPDGTLVLASVSLIIVLIFLGYRFKDSRIIAKQKIFRPKIFSLLAFLFMSGFSIIPYKLASIRLHQSVLVSYQLMIIFSGLLFGYFQILNKNITRTHLTYLVSGSLFFWCLIDIILELQGFSGMSLVGIVSMMILFRWKKMILSQDNI